MGLQINKITNANIYMDGNSHLGKAAEVELPQANYKMAEHAALGMVGMAEFFSGIEKLEMKIKWNSFYADAMKATGNPTTSRQIQIRSSLETHTSAGKTAEVPVVCHVTAAPKSFPMGNFKQSDNVELETDFAVYYCKLEIDGENIFEVDILANIFKVGGVDLLAKYRANLGI